MAAFRVLVVDDEDSVLEIVAEFLQHCGWKVETSNLPSDALEQIKRGTYDALVLDLYMPEMPGLLMHARVKVLDRELAKRTVLMTGHFSHEEIRRDLEGKVPLLMKPFQPHELVGMVSQVLPLTPRSNLQPARSGG